MGPAGEVLVGICSSRYLDRFKVHELQDTFYEPSRDRIGAVARRAEPGHIFSVKAWQVFTHGPNSPTWRRMRSPPDAPSGQIGGLMPTEANMRLWGRFIELTRPLAPRFYIFQTPPTFTPHEGVPDFFRSVMGSGYMVGWEPRGRSFERPDILRRTFDLGVIHVVDPFRREPMAVREVQYVRLHGVGPGEANYGYKYTRGDFDRLLDVAERWGVEVLYVLFNNIHMARDAAEFREHCAARGLRCV